ncbi:MotB-like transcriptional regulator [Escherichia phage vB_EcoM_VR25]|uniref:Modifier of transcription n=1 Tax=Escherichia phage vB_EcoM_VR25 TaxID=1567028 RepID=A0A0A7HGC3_9CAUD|nr:MotB-like transcriptional regulator [Escherichia phage vB_EcoM_VR25]AIZ02354.1 modifier of transcription [Escherichia phage vB_EcoM_VR25]
MITISDIGGIVRVSKQSRSKAAGRLVEVVSIQLKEGVRLENAEVKVRVIPKNGQTETQFGYVRAKFLESTEFTGYIAPVVEEVETIDQSHVGVDFKWKLGKGVFFVSPKPFEYICKYGPTYETTSMSGYITDQWVEEGVKLYNIVFLGTFKVIPESFIVEYADIHFA